MSGNTSKHSATRWYEGKIGGRIMSLTARTRHVTLASLGLVSAVASAVGFVAKVPAADDDFRPQRAVPQQSPIKDFPVKPVRDARGDVNPTELVLCVTVDKQSRAYPINMLTGPEREILNDAVGGKEIAATW